MGRMDAALIEMPERKPAKPSKRRASAEDLAQKQREISVSEFFAKNRHLLGFDSPRKALLTAVKEAVDNSLDACEEAGILPSITVVIEDLQPGRPASARSGRYRVTVVDNGPGIVRKQVENIFGRLLYGSKFHRLKMSRGQQGIGISAAGMYGLITTGQPMVIHTKPGAKAKAHHIELAMNTRTNRAEVTLDRETDDFPPSRLLASSSAAKNLGAAGELFAEGEFTTGTSVSIELEGRYQRGRGSVDEFLELTAIANPHGRFVFVPPSRESEAEDEQLELEQELPSKRRRRGAEADAEGEGHAPQADRSAKAGAKRGEGDGDGADERDGAAGSGIAAVTTELLGATIFPRAVGELPAETREIQPHPRGIELGTLLQMLKEYEAAEKGSLYAFLQERFCRISAASAASICKVVGVTSRTRISAVDTTLAEAIYREFQNARFPSPPTDCLSPIGVRQMLAGMLKGVRAEFYAASSREPAIYRGRPFQIEAAIAFGGDLPADEPARVIRFANRVPLLFQQSACSSFRGVVETSWRNYDLQQPRGSLPVGPIVIMLHVASVWVPFTSESKEAIADYDEIRKEMKLALMECGRKLGGYLRKRSRMRREGERRDVFERYIGEIVRAVHAINGTNEKQLFERLKQQAKRRTAIADQVLDEDGKVKKEEDPSALEGVIIVGETAPPPPPEIEAPSTRTRAAGRGTRSNAPASKSKPGATGSKSPPSRGGKAGTRGAGASTRAAAGDSPGSSASPGFRRFKRAADEQASLF
ncbi:MAG: DNA topoisomerase VI subunit B [Phycisphaerae bacterium]|nr:DNA topoisomerase VI subunit B [Phycisphaerae bacterium]